MSSLESNPDVSGIQAAVERGSAAKALWVETGEVVPASALAHRWGITSREVADAARQGELSSIVIVRHRYYPKEFLEIEFDTARAASRALSGLSTESMLVFWKRQHGALGGKTAVGLLRDEGIADRNERVLELAQCWAAQSLAGSKFRIGTRRKQLEAS